MENNSKFVRGRKRAKENIERYCLEPYGMKQLESGNYELTIRLTEFIDPLEYSANDGLSRDFRGCIWGSLNR